MKKDIERFSKMYGTTTGRFVQNINIQNVELENICIRKLVTPKPGTRFVEIDFSKLLEETK